MATLMLTGCSSTTTTSLRIPSSPKYAFLQRHSNRPPNWTFFPRRSSSDDAAKVIDVLPVASQIIDDLKTEASRMKKSIGAVPGLAAILFGDTRHSETYTATCGLVGIKTSIVRLPEDSSEEEVLKSVSRFNDDPSIHGITLQLPLPWHNIFDAVSVEKDVEGFNPLNMARLAMPGKEPLFLPCAPKGCIELLHRCNVEIKGKRAVVIGRSDDFCIPVALLLQREDATVTIIHSTTKNPEEITRQDDIIISAVKQPYMVRGSWIKPGAVLVLNVEQSFVMDRNARDGFRIVEDICYEEICKVASAILPFERSVSSMELMAFVMLLSNTLTSVKRTHNFMQP